MIVVDTSVMINLFKGRETPAVLRLKELLSMNIPFCIPDICCQELLQGARNEQEWGTLRDYLSGQEILCPTDPWGVSIRAARIWYDCRRAGVTVSSSVDCRIAQLTLDVDGWLLHEDSDFDLIGELRPLKMWPTN